MSILPKTRWLPVTMLVVSALGFLDATYLTVSGFTNASIPCTISHGCDVVTTSVYADILGIPVALLGALYYLCIFGMIFVAMDTHNRRLLRVAGLATTAGFLMSAWLVYAQVALIEALCQWCLISAFTSTILFVFGAIVLPVAIRKEQNVVG